MRSNNTATDIVTIVHSAADIIHILRKQISAGSGILHISVNVLYVRC